MSVIIPRLLGVQELPKSQVNYCLMQNFLRKASLCVCVCARSLQSCLTLCSTMDYTLPGSSVHGILQARILEWVAMPSPGNHPNPGIEPESPALQVDSLSLDYRVSPKESIVPTEF